MFTVIGYNSGLKCRKTRLGYLTQLSAMNQEYAVFLMLAVTYCNVQ
jgi:hypothetical protein